MGPGAIALIAATALAAAPGGGFWNETVSPHFVVRHEAPFLPPGFALRLEKIHNRLRMDLSMFSPWMAKERLKIYLYASRESYAKGEFKPPAWSNGIAFRQQKLVAVHNQPSLQKLVEVLGHETTHLLFESYWWERGGPPPQWLNEGLAMMEEIDDPRTPERSDWFQAMSLLEPDKAMPVQRFMEIRPTTDLQDQDKETVSLWYLQAYSLVHFLYREHSRLQFLNFCGRLRDGKELDSALWDVYRYRGAVELDRAWRAWLAKPTTVARIRRYQRYSASPEEQAAPGQAKDGDGRAKLKGFGFKDFGFHSVQQK
ncbi:MAG: hypothetical protein HY554_16400 [Elusimicrobia bacterium]|nr:hypothetical protein [Elusimicrobiota bacterium]